MTQYTFKIHKMQTSLDPEHLDQVRYQITDLQGRSFDLNQLLGQHISINFGGHAECIACGRELKKTLQDGYCYPCSKTLARCDLCIVRPERCHYAQGTCREPEWGLQHCMIPHSIYIAWSSGPKVGVTRSHQRLTRWMDQGAVSAVEVARVPTRLEAGQIEVLLSQHFADKSQWRKLLTENPEPVDLKDLYLKAVELMPSGQPHLQIQHFEQQNLRYPILKSPQKAVSWNLQKKPNFSGKVWGIRGQYLITDCGGLNMRKHQGMFVEWQLPTAPTENVPK